jgi:DNA-binding NtrC family response regulator
LQRQIRDPARIILTFPHAPATALDMGHKKETPSPTSSAPDDRPVLFVTRDDNVGELYVAALTAHGKNTRRIRDCSSAAALLAEIDAAAVFIDVLDEPDWSDCAGLARVAAEHATPVIVVTGWVAPDARFRKRAFAAGCAAFIAKPCTAATLLTTLERVATGERGIEVVAHRKLARPSSAFADS